MRKLSVFALLTLAGGVFYKLIPFMASVVISNAVGVAYFAEFSFALNTANTIVSVFAMGLSPAILTALSAANNEDSADSKGRMLQGLLRITVLIALVVMVVGVLVEQLVTSTATTGMVYGFIFILVPALVLNQATYAMYQALERYVSSVVQSFILMVLVLGATYIGLLFGFEESAHVFYALAYLFVGVVAFILLSNFSKKNFDTRRGQATTWVLLRHQAPFAGYTAVWMLAIYLCNLKVAHDYSSTELAIYNVGFQIYALTLMAPALLGGVLIPYFAGRVSAEKDGSRTLVITGVYGLVGLPVVIVFMLLSPQILKIYSIEVSEEAINTMRIFLAAGLVAIMVTPTLQLYLARRWFAKLYSISALWTIVALLGVSLFSGSAMLVVSWFFLAYVGVAVIVSFDLWRLVKKGAPCPHPR